VIGDVGCGDSVDGVDGSVANSVLYFFTTTVRQYNTA
jgi:hypothetical protein